MDESTACAAANVRIELIGDATDVELAFVPALQAFGHQTQDAIWMAMHPGWDTVAGQAANAQRMVQRWRATTTDRHGRPNTMFVKATVGDGPGDRHIVGLAIWVQLSAIPGHGDLPCDDVRDEVDLAQLYPDQPAEQQFVRQVINSLHRRRVQVVREKASSASAPSALVLDLCAVSPAWQGRGIARKLVQWGLDEARKRGDVEVLLEASAMGRRVYSKLGFAQDGAEIQYVFDHDPQARRLPSNIFMRTQGP